MCSRFNVPKKWSQIEPEESSTENEVDSDDDDNGISDSASTPAQDSSVPSTVSETPCLLPVSQSSSSCCRICQDSSDTSEPLDTSKCLCKGQLAIVHKRCLLEWVRYKGSNRCEICGGIFHGVPNPPRDTLGVNDIEALDSLRQQLEHFQPISRRKRSGLGAFLAFLVLITGVMGFLSYGADIEFRAVTEDPFASDHDLRKAHIVFSICLSFLFFCITLTLGIAIMWGVLELFFYLHRRRIVRSAARRMLNEVRRRRETGTSSGSTAV
ncbi:hypothetical protein ACF0H5_013833 [Mactra antiquata]